MVYGLDSYGFWSHVIGLVRTLGGKCIMKIEDGLPMIAKATELVEIEAVYSLIDTMEGILLRILRVTTSTTNPSVVMIIGSLREHTLWR